jgi:TonB family protein
LIPGREDKRLLPATPSLLRAAAAGDTELVKKLLLQGANVDVTTERGQTPLMLASISGLLEVVRVLLEAGADAQLRDRLGLTALDWSQRRGFSEVTELLTKHGEARQPAPKPPEAVKLPAESIIETPVTPTATSDPRPAEIATESATAEELILASPISSTETAPSDEKPSAAPTEELKSQISDLRPEISEKERTRLDDIARTQALFDQLNAADKPSSPPEVKSSETSKVVPVQADKEDAPAELAQPEKVLPMGEGSADWAEHHDVVPLTAADVRPDQEVSTAATDSSLAENQAPPALPSEIQLSQEDPTHQEPQPANVEGERAANELAREKSRLEAERLAEATRLRVEEALRLKLSRQKLEEQKVEASPDSVSQKQETKREEPARQPEQIDERPASKDVARRAAPLRVTRIITPDIWPTQPEARPVAAATTPDEMKAVEPCPRCGTDLEGAVCPNCEGNERTLSGVPSFNSPQPVGLGRPTVWLLMSVTLAVGVILGYQMNEYLSKNQVTSATPAAAQTQPPPVTAKPEVTPATARDLPVVGGDLIGAEGSIPEPEYPAQAKRDGVSGEIKVRVRVNSRGRVVLVRSSSGDWRLRAAAVQAARNATFLPEKLPADARFVSGTITYTFKP